MTLRRGSNGGEKMKVISGLCLRGLVCSHLLCALALAFRTLSHASVQSLRSRDARLLKLALHGAWTRASCTMYLKRGSTSWKWSNQDWRGLKGRSTKMIQWFSCVDLTPQSILERAKQRDTSRHFRDSLIIKPIGLFVVVYHFNQGWYLDFECCLMGQHDASKKCWQSSWYAETLQFVIS